MIKKFGLPILTMFGIGYFKYAPGTAASFITCIIYLTIDNYTKVPLRGDGKIFLLVFLIIILFYSITFIDKIFKRKDANEIVVDEFVGQCIPLLAWSFRPENFIPNCCRKFQLEDPQIIWILLAFILFRFFDILKPFPINIVDKKMKNGVGVMLDDIIAGIYSTIVIYIIFALWF